MAIHKLSRYFDRLGNKLNAQTEDIYDKTVNKYLSVWMSDKKAELSDLKVNLDNYSAFIIVNDIDERNSLLNTKTPGTLVWVKDAGGDSTVKSGGAAYLLRKVDNRLFWEKMTEEESMDITLDMSIIVGKPEKLGEVDDAVEKAHEHPNLEILNGAGTANGHLTYNGIELSGQTGIDDRLSLETAGNFTSKMKIVQEVILPDIDSLSSYLYLYQPLR